MLRDRAVFLTAKVRSAWPREPLALFLALGALCVCLWPAAVEAQEPQTTAPVRPGAHRFFDAPNVVLTGVEITALITDGVYTQRGLKKFGGREADPIARPFVSRGWPGQIAGGTLFVSAEVALRYALHRKGHHRLERFLPVVLTVYGATGAIHNARVLHRLETLR